MDPVEEIKARLSVEDVVGRYVDLRRSGSAYKGLCPFHNEKTPSFYVTPSRGSYKCFGCGKGGDIFTFVQDIQHLQFPEALKQLAEEAGVQLPERKQGAPSLKGKLHEANEVAARFFADTLRSAPGERARAYLEGRGYDGTAIELFGLGYAPAARDLLVQHLRNAGFDERIQLAAGLALGDESGGALRDRFRSRLIFPIRDAGGKISGFGGRTLESDVQPKYLNSPQTEIFDKSSVLYGIHLAGEAIRQSGAAVLVEGYLDAVGAHIHGFKNVVASLGTAVTVSQLLGLSRWTQHVVLALDPDPAGQAAAARTAITALAELTRQRGRVEGGSGAIALLIARLPDGRDPDELIAAAPAKWEAAIATAIPAFDFFFEQSLDSLDRSTPAWRQEAIDRLLPVIQQFGDSAGFQATWIQRLSGETGIDPRALLQTLPTTRPARGTRRKTEVSSGGETVVSDTTSRGLTNDPRIGVEAALVALLLKVVVIPDAVAHQLEGISFERREHSTLLESLLLWRSTENYDYLMFRETLSGDVRDYADELYGRDIPLPDDAKISVSVAYHLARLLKLRAQFQIDTARALLEELEPEDRPAMMQDLVRLTTQVHDLERELDTLSREVVKFAG